LILKEKFSGGWRTERREILGEAKERGVLVSWGAGKAKSHLQDTQARNRLGDSKLRKPRSGGEETRKRRRRKQGNGKS